MARREKEKGRKRERYGFQFITSELAPRAWLVHVYSKRPGDGVEMDGFDFEGQALDWAEDWAHQNRLLSHRVRHDDDGFIVTILDHVSHEIQRLAPQPSANAAEGMAIRYIDQLRRHDLALIAERHSNRANYRMEMEDLQERQEYLDSQVAAAKDALKKIDETREQLRKGLLSPQVEFNFVLRGEDREQLDLDDSPKRRRDPAKTLTSLRGGRSDQPEAPTT